MNHPFPWVILQSVLPPLVFLPLPLLPSRAQWCMSPCHSCSNSFLWLLVALSKSPCLYSDLRNLHHGFLGFPSYSVSWDSSCGLSALIILASHCLQHILGMSLPGLALALPFAWRKSLRYLQACSCLLQVITQTSPFSGTFPDQRHCI